MPNASRLHSRPADDAMQILLAHYTVDERFLGDVTLSRY